MGAYTGLTRSVLSAEAAGPRDRARHTRAFRCQPPDDRAPRALSRLELFERAAIVSPVDTRAADRKAIEDVLSAYAAIPYAHGNVETQTVFDRASDHYLLMIVGHE